MLLLHMPCATGLNEFCGKKHSPMHTPNARISLTSKLQAPVSDSPGPLEGRVSMHDRKSVTDGAFTGPNSWPSMREKGY